MRRSINQNQPRKDSFYKTRKRGLKVIVNVICSEAREKTECNLSKKQKKDPDRTSKNESWNVSDALPDIQ